MDEMFLERYRVDDAGLQCKLIVPLHYNSHYNLHYNLLGFLVIMLTAKLVARQW